MTYDAPVITGGPRGTFAWGVIHERNPAIAAEVRDALPYGPDVRRRLDALAEEITEGVMTPPAAGAHERRAWLEWGGDWFGRPWADAPFLGAESYFFHRLLDAAGYFGPGPWRGVDPFAGRKAAELSGDALDVVARLDDLPAADRDTAVLRAALWGNRADLAFRTAAGHRPGAAGLLADDGARVWSLLDARPGGTVHVVADNAAGELAADLALIDHLLATGRAAEVVLHLKPRPYYVSDATPADVPPLLRRLPSRLWSALTSGRVRLTAHPFFCTPLGFAAMPADLRAQFAAATLTILKGDLNHRRLVGDRYWPAPTPFTELTAYFPSPVASLRVLKSDVAVGLSGPVPADPSWRTSGSHAVIQVNAAR